MCKQEESVFAPHSINILLSQEERDCVGRILSCYADVLRRVMPPSVQRTEILTTITRLHETPATLDVMEEGASLAIDGLCVITIQEAFTLFMAGVVPLLPVGEQQKQFALTEAENLKRHLAGGGQLSAYWE